jgi:hypothetical protein
MEFTVMYPLMENAMKIKAKTDDIGNYLYFVSRNNSILMSSGNDNVYFGIYSIFGYNTITYSTDEKYNDQKSYRTSSIIRKYDDFEASIAEEMK